MSRNATVNTYTYTTPTTLKKRRIVIHPNAMTLSVFKKECGGNTRNASFCCQTGCDA